MIYEAIQVYAGRCMCIYVQTFQPHVGTGHQGGGGSDVGTGHQGGGGSDVGTGHRGGGGAESGITTKESLWETPASTQFWNRT